MLSGYGKPTVQWGNLGKAEIDMLIRFETLICWFSCKRTQAAQSMSSFEQHIRHVEVRDRDDVYQPSCNIQPSM